MKKQLRIIFGILLLTLGLFFAVKTIWSFAASVTAIPVQTEMKIQNVMLWVWDSVNNTPRTVNGDASGNIFLLNQGFGTLGNFQATATNVAAALASHACNHFTIQADKGNTDKVYVGTSGVTTATGFPLSAGDTLTLDLTNTNLLYVLANSGSQTMEVIFEN